MRDTAQLLLLDRDAIAALLTADLALHAVRDAFTLHSRREGRVFPVVREQLANGVFGIKSGDVAARRLLGFKAAGFWPANRLHGGEPHQATVMLFDPATGRPMCLMDGNAITTARTAAAAELGTLLLARADSTRLTVFGTGVCDWTKPGVGQQAAVSPLTFAGGAGGVAMPGAPVSMPK